MTQLAMVTMGPVPTVPWEQAKIGDGVSFLAEGTHWCGRVMDIRRKPECGPEARTLYAAVLGWPSMFTLELGCLHPRGFNAAGLCFDCLHKIGPSVNEKDGTER